MSFVNPNVKFINGRDSESQLAFILQVSPGEKGKKTFISTIGSTYVVPILSTDRYAKFSTDNPIGGMLISSTFPFPTPPTPADGATLADVDIICGLDSRNTYAVLDLRSYLPYGQNEFYVQSSIVQCCTILLYSDRPT